MRKVPWKTNVRSTVENGYMEYRGRAALQRRVRLRKVTGFSPRGRISRPQWVSRCLLNFQNVSL
jgi:hypothetical protein